MIKTIGARRAVILLILIGANVVMAGLYFLFLMPQNEKTKNQLNEVNGKISVSRANIEQMKNQFAIIQQQKEQFGKLQQAGFFTSQDRVQGRDRFGAIQKYSHVLLASYDIKAAQIERSQALTDAGQVMLTTPVDVSVDALDDIDFYNFLYLVQNAFPGFISIENIEINRDRELDDVALREIGSGIPAAMIKSKIAFKWKTIVPEKQLQLPTEPQAGM